ncbi:lysozyme B-like [Drosophila novamexicana]|uniref:lysozyme B-like n=1 Tax=Drosophila novamexicana TaxID=47314 RepID=UPI0011E592B1|nr:lysozyme B-like [Drosophila novamexicana]
MKAFIVLVALAFAALTLGRTMDRCSLAREMSDLGVPRNQLNKWTCIAEHESNYRTDVVGPMNGNGSHDYGIFQINDLYWCEPSHGPSYGRSSNICEIDCDDLLGNSIVNDVRCAQKVYKEQGWCAWTTWHQCSGALPSIDDCF